jgi:hypothetical protein
MPESRQESGRPATIREAWRLASPTSFDRDEIANVKRRLQSQARSGREHRRTESAAFPGRIDIEDEHQPAIAAMGDAIDDDGEGNLPRIVAAAGPRTESPQCRHPVAESFRS